MKEIADNWQMGITEISWSYEKALKDLPAPKFNRKPSPEQWSAGEIFDHLIRVNASYLPVFDRIIAGSYKTPILGKVPFLGKKTGEMILASMRKPAKIKTFPVWEPSKSLLNPSIVREFFNLQDELSAYVQKLDPHFGKNLMIASPASQWVVYSLDQAISIILAHEQRHLAQLKNTVGR